MRPWRNNKTIPPHDPLIAITVYAGAAILRGIFVVGVPAITRPFKSIAHGVIKAKIISRELPNFSRAVGAPLAFAILAVGEVLPQIIPPGKSRGGTTAMGVFPFGLRG